ncbi:uncharacterized protein LOC144175991 isoform X6 [Haemaphysalis longicornis]
MKAVLALTLFAVVGLAYAQDDICSLPAESRASFVHCHLSEEAPHAGFFTPGTRAALRAVFAFCTANH